MPPEDEQPPGPGDELDDDDPATPWLPPDDRLWRHPSEVRANPAVGRRAPAGAVGRLAESVQARIWLVGVISGVVGALVSAGVLVGSGAVDAPGPVGPTIAKTVPIGTGTTTVPNTPDNTAILDAVEPSTVGLDVNGAQGTEIGSGVIVYTSGDECYVLTDSTLFSEAGPSSQVQVVSYWGDVRRGHLIGQDPTSGIAVLKVALEPAADVSTANPGTVAAIQSGEDVYSIGSQSMAGSSNGSDFAAGVIQDTSSYLQPVNGSADGMFSMLVADMSVDASAYGGALVDSSGQVLGITNPMSGNTKPGLIYVTPIDTAMNDVSSMIKNGRPAAHPWLGILQATDMSGPRAQHMGVAGAVQVDTVASGSPAAKAGISDNDIVTMLAGHNVSSVGALIAWLADAKPGQVTTIAWLHDGHRHKADITLGTQPSSASPS